jgi:hypothetical protein
LHADRLALYADLPVDRLALHVDRLALYVDLPTDQLALYADLRRSACLWLLHLSAWLALVMPASHDRLSPVFFLIKLHQLFPRVNHSM